VYLTTGGSVCMVCAGCARSAGWCIVVKACLAECAAAESVIMWTLSATMVNHRPWLESNTECDGCVCPQQGPALDFQGWGWEFQFRV
jgi:hypothetical protein